MDACAENTHTRPDQTGAAGGGQQRITFQPKPDGQQYQPVGRQGRVGKHPHGQGRKQHQNAGTRHSSPAAGSLFFTDAPQPGQDGLGETALQRVAGKAPPAEILEPGRQDRAQAFEEQRQQRDGIGKQDAGAVGVDVAVVGTDVGQMDRALAEEGPAQVVLGGVGAGIVENPVHAGRIQHLHPI